MWRKWAEAGTTSPGTAGCVSEAELAVLEDIEPDMASIYGERSFQLAVKVVKEIG